MQRDPEPPFDLGKFYVLGPIGEGGTGVVYAAQLDDRLVALKVLRRDIALTDKEIRAFVNEGERARRVVHPSLVPVIDVGTLPDGRPYIAMPRLKGESLASRLARGPFAMSRALSLFEGLASATAALHDAGLIHRDIKPENVFVEKQADGGERLVLLDLGIAREINAPQSTTTQQGLVRGTPAYMAPERFFGTPATIGTDVYELAVVLAIMLTGELPWNPNDPKDRLSSVSSDALAKRLPLPMATTLARALSMNAVERPRTATELCEEVKRAASGSPSHPTGPVQVTPASARDMRRSEIARMSNQETQSATPFPSDATTAKKSRSGGGVVAVIVAVVIAAGLVVASRFAFVRPPNDAPSLASAAASVAPILAASDVSSAPSASGAAGEIVSAASSTKAPISPAPGLKSQSSTATTLTSATPAVSAQAAPASASSLPNCKALVGLYCSPEWLATEGPSAGRLCEAFRGNVKTWQATPEDARETYDQACARSVTQGRMVLKERQAAIAAGAVPR